MACNKLVRSKPEAPAGDNNKMFGLIRKIGENQVAPAGSGGAPLAYPRNLLSQLTESPEALAMPSIAVEMEQLEGQATKWKPVAEPAEPKPVTDWLDETAASQLHHGVEVDDISQEEFDRHLALFAARVPG